jgi:hypothetical protein
MRLLKLPFLLLAFLATHHALCFGQGLEGRYFEREGGFSYQPPGGWRIANIPGMKYKFAFGLSQDGFSPNMNFVDEAHSGSLQSYVDANLKVMQSMFKGFEKINQTTFKTGAGQTAIKLTTQAEQNGKMIRQLYYFFEASRDKKLVVTGSAPARGKEAFDRIFDESVRTLIFDR